MLNLKNLLNRSCHIIVLLTLSVVEVILIFGTGIPARADLAPMYRFEQLFRVFDFPWDYKSNLGSPVYYNGNIVYNLPLIMLSQMLRSVPTAHTVYLVLLVYVCGYGFYKMLKEWTGHKLSSLIGSIYVLASWVCYRLGLGHNTIMFGTAILPYLLLASIKYLKSINLKFLLFSLPLIILLTYSSIHIAALAILMILIMAVAESLDGTQPNRLMKALTLVLFTFSSFIISFTPILFHLTHIPNLINVIREEESNFYTVNLSAFTPYNCIHLILGFFVILVYLHGYRRRLKRKEYYMPIFLLFIGFLLSFGGTPPIGFLYNWLFINIPGFTIFREANKFLLLSVIGMSIMVSLSFRAILKCPNRVGRILAAFLILTLLAFSSQSSYRAPILPKISLPEYWVALDSYLWNESGWYRVAYLPPANWATNYRWGKVQMLDFLVALQPKPTLEVKSEMDITLGSSMIRWLYTRIYKGMIGRSTRLLELFGVKYLVYRSDAYMPEYRDDLKIFNRGEALTSILSYPSNDLSVNTGSLRIYTIENPLSHLYLCGDFTLLAGSRDALITLTNYGWDFRSSALIFTDNLKSGDLEIIKEKLGGIIIEGTSTLPLIASLLKSSGKAVAIEAWKLAGMKGDPRKSWVLGDFVWWHHDGDMLSYPGRYLFSSGSNKLEFGFKVDKRGVYRILLQAFTGPKELGKLDIQVDSSKFEVDLGSQVLYGGFRWLELPALMLESGEHTITIKNYGDAALSQILVVEEAVFKECSEELEEVLGEDASLYYLLEDKLWIGGEPVSSSNCSLGSGIKLSKSAYIRVDVLRSGEYLLDLLLGESLKENMKICLKADGEVYSYRLNPGWLNYTLGPIYLTRGEHTLCIESEGKPEALLDFTVLRADRRSYTLFHPVEYEGGGSMYGLSLEKPGIVVFLESYSEGWVLCDSSHLEAPHILALGFANAYLVREAGKYTLKYIGYDCLMKGLLVTTIALPFMLAAILCFNHRWRNWKKEILSKT